MYLLAVERLALEQGPGRALELLEVQSSVVLRPRRGIVTMR
jgi:hypothetical protein